MSSRVAAILPVPNGIGIHIDHLPYDSYSRSVGPLATRTLKSAAAIQVMKTNGWPGGGTIWRGEWDFSQPDPRQGVSRTVVTFTWVDPAL